MKEKLPEYFNNMYCEFTRPHTVQRDEFVSLACSIAGKVRLASIPYKSGSRAVYFSKSDAEICYKKIIMNLVNNYGRYEKIYDNSVKELHAVSKSVEKSVKFPDKEKAKKFQKWTIAMKNYFIPVMAPFAVERILDGQCRKLFEKEFGEKSENFFAIISSPTRLNFYQKMRLEIDDLVISQKINSKEIGKLIKKYSWYGEYSYIESFLDEKYFRKELSKLTRQKAIEEKKYILLDVKKNKKAYSILKKKIKKSKVAIMAKILNDYTFLRTDRIENFKLAQSRIRPLFKYIEDELNDKTKQKWTQKDIANFTNKEIIGYLQSGKIPNREELKKRVSHNYIYYFDTKPHFIYNSKTISRALKIIQESGNNGQEIKGLVAFRGKARGMVAMVHSKKDLPKVKKGTILVARTTMPDYTHAMKKASGFVTEEGGITSHAAIISRELKKPCIVGTGNCTKILKDGDLVEVDANQGIVKILKKK